MPTNNKESQAATYASSGVSYADMDPFKRAALGRAIATVKNLDFPGFRVVTESFGDSAFLIETPLGFIAQVIEGLGTKNVVAEAMQAITGRPYYANVGQCNAAMIINDMLTSGAMPLSIMLYVAAGSSEWFQNKEAAESLVDGFGHACDLSGVVWGGGETPTLRDIIMPGTVDLAGAAVGIIQPKSLLISSRNITAGDAIVVIKSSGVHANGITLIRKIAQKLPKGYETPLQDGRCFGEAVLTPTLIYRDAVRACQLRDIPINYAVNVTGHGWRKFMRPIEPWTYVIDSIPEPQDEFRLIQELTGMSDREIYGDYNMGAGFALYVPNSLGDDAIAAVNGAGYEAILAGYVDTPVDNKKRVIINPLGVEYSEEELQLR